MTLTIQIGNSDDKLTQRQWSQFVTLVGTEIGNHASKMFFFGAPSNYEEWQNVAWIFEIQPAKKNALAKNLNTLRVQFNQDSIAWTEGETIFI